MKARPYQQQAHDAVLAEFDKGVSATLVMLPTGGGKTIVAAEVAKSMLAKGRVMVLVHRDELLRQAVNKFTRVIGIVPSVEKAEERSIEDSLQGKPPVVVCSIQTLNSLTHADADEDKPDDEKRRRFDRFDLMEIGFIWVDEAHHIVARTYSRLIRKALKVNPNIKVLGVTATGDRADGRLLGEIFKSIAFDYQLPDIIRDGYLCGIRQHAVKIDGLDFSKVSTIAGDLNEQDLEAAMMVEKPLHGVAHATIEVSCGLDNGFLAEVKDKENRAELLEAALLGKRRRRTLLFCVTIAHSKRMVEILERWMPGCAKHIDGKMPLEDRRDVLKDFAEGKFQFLSNCMVATEGFDEPGIELVVMARPTKSRPLYTQMVGRGTRPLADLADQLGDLPYAEARKAAIAASPKPFCQVLDFVGNAGRHKLITSIDILGEAKGEEVIERAKEIAEEQDIDVTSAIDQAEAEIEDEKAANRAMDEMEAERQAKEEEDRLLAEAARRAQLLGTATSYRLKQVNSIDPGDVSAERETGIKRGGASDKQIDLLMGLGVQKETAAAYSKRQASAVIDDLRRKKCTTKQAKTLRRAGYSELEITAFNVDSASREIDHLAANNWRREAVA